jgi:predicted amidohydrolase YtcJ
VAIRGDNIVAVGNSSEVEKAVGKDAARVDLHGRALLPGLIDSHVPAILGGVSLNSADVGDSVQSVAELVTFAADVAPVVLVRGGSQKCLCTISN